MTFKWKMILQCPKCLLKFDDGPDSLDMNTPTKIVRRTCMQCGRNWEFKVDSNGGMLRPLDDPKVVN